MEYFCWAFLLTALATVYAEDPEVKIMDSTRRIEKPGMSMELSCHVNQGLPVILTHTIEWVHVSLANSSNPNVTGLTRQQTLTDKASPSDYDINVDYDSSRCLFKLVVKKVRAQDDGIFICRVTNNDNGQKIEKEAHVIVVNDVEKIALRFDGEESIQREEKVGLQREEGRYGVTCMASGFNPDATIKLFLGDQEQETGGTQITLDRKASVAAGARRYSARATATDVHLKAEHSGRRLKCQAHAGFDGAATLVASVPLSVIVLEPVVTCDKNASARPGERFVKIKCHVKHENIEIERYSWEISALGEIIAPDLSNDNFHEVTVQELGNDMTLVTLDLFEVGEEHFDTVYYLDIFTSGGQTFRTEAELIRKEPDTSASPKTSAAFVVCLLSTVLGLVSCL